MDIDMILKMLLLFAVISTALKVLYVEEGTLTEKLAYVARWVTGTKNVSLNHVAKYGDRPNCVYMFAH